MQEVEEELEILLALTLDLHKSKVFFAFASTSISSV
jgi:hypothetical protein